MTRILFYLFVILTDQCLYFVASHLNQMSLQVLMAQFMTHVWNLKFSSFVTFSAILRLGCDYPVVTGVRNWSTQRKPPPKRQLPHMSGSNSNPDRCERQLHDVAISGNALYLKAIRAGP